LITEVELETKDLQQIPIWFDSNQRQTVTNQMCVVYD